jgi:spore coat protein U-like protein
VHGLFKHVPITVAVALLATVAASPRVIPAGSVTGTMNVTATVVANCAFTSGTLTFGNYDAIAVNATAPLKISNSTTALSISCTKKTSATISLNNGTHSASCSGSKRCMSDGTGDYLNYAIYTDGTFATIWDKTHTVSYTSTGAGTPVLDVNAELAAGQNAPAGSYSDTITATATF